MARSPGARLGWRGENNAPGLQVELLEHPRSKPYKTYCLGGRDQSDLTGRSHFNLFLRGPKNSTGHFGADPHSSICGGNSSHDNIKIPRGHYFRIRARLSIEGGTDDFVDALVSVKYYFDEYISREIEDKFTRTCSKRLLPNGTAPETLCPTKQTCLQDLKGEVASLTCSYRIDAKPIGCTDDMVNSWESASPSEIEYPVCGDSDAPAINSGICGWEKLTTTTSRASFSEISAAECPLRKTVTNHTQCDKSDSTSHFACDKSGVEPSDCPEVAKIVSTSERYAGSREHLRSLSFDNFKVTQEAAPLLAWTPVDENGVPHTCAIKRVESVELPQPEFDRRDPNWKPELTTHIKLDGKVAPEEVRAQFHISRVPNSTERIEMKGYPFDNARETELSESLPQVVNGLNICTGAPATLEARLRAYASLPSNPHRLLEAANPDLRFDAAQERASRGPVLLPQIERCSTDSSTNSNTCSKTSVVAMNTYHFCKPAEAIGRISGMAPSKDPRCSGPGVHCSCTPVELTPQELTLDDLTNDVAQEEAIKRGIEVIEKSMGRTQLNCRNPNCSSILIERRSPFQIEVTASYHLPLIFPLDRLLQSNSIELTASKVEQIELARALD